MPSNLTTSVLCILISLCISMPVLADMDLSDDAVVKELIEMAAHGNPEAQLMLGDLHFNGEHVSKDIKKAARLYEAAAKQGLKRAQGITGGLYYLGKGVRKDHKMARYWLELAANQNLQEAKMLLASMERSQRTSSSIATRGTPVTMSLNAMAR